MTIPCQSEQGASCREGCQKCPTAEGEAEIGADDRRTVNCLTKITSDFNYVGVRLFVLNGAPPRTQPLETAGRRYLVPQPTKIKPQSEANVGIGGCVSPILNLPFDKF